MIKTVEEIELIGKKKMRVLAKIDTGAWRTSVDRSLCKDMGYVPTGKKHRVRSALGKSSRTLIEVKFVLGGKEIETIASVADRSDLKYLIIIGRKDLKGFTVSI